MPSNQDAQRPHVNDLAEETAKAVQLTKDLADFDRYLRETSETSSQLRSLPDEADVTRVISTGRILDRNGRELRAIVERGEPLDPDDVQSLCSMLTHAQRLRQDVSQYSISAPAAFRPSQPEIAFAVRAAEAIEVLVTSVFERAGIDPTPVLLCQNPDLERTAWIRLAGSLQAARLVRSEGSKKAGVGHSDFSIPAEFRTSPMSYRRAAKLMGKGDSQDAAEWLSKSVEDRSIPCEHLSRQTHVFDRRCFPKDSQSLIVPQVKKSQPKST